jgi:membrane-associated phospholipid phosphatase
MKLLAEILSWIFLPLLMPIYGLMLAMYIPSNQDYFFNTESLYFLTPEAKELILYMFFIFSALAPGLSFFMLHRRKVISTIDMESAKERSIPMLIMFGYCLLLYILFVLKAPNNILPKYIYALPLAGTLVTALYTYINFYIKISLHGGGAGILSGFIFAYASVQQEYQFWILPAVIIASGLTIFARLFLKKHTPTEVYTGWSVAFIITFCCNYFYPN